MTKQLLKFKKTDKAPHELWWSIRKTAKEPSVYFKKISDPITTTTHLGDKVYVNTLGKLLFGVPGFKALFMLKFKPEYVELSLSIRGLNTGSIHHKDFDKDLNELINYIKQNHPDIIAED